MNAKNSSGLIKFKEKINIMTQFKTDFMLSTCLIFH